MDVEWISVIIKVLFGCFLGFIYARTRINKTKIDYLDGVIINIRKELLQLQIKEGGLVTHQQLEKCVADSKDSIQRILRNEEPI